MPLQLFYDLASAVHHATASASPAPINRWERAVLRSFGATGYRLADPKFDRSLLETTNEVFRAFDIPDNARVIIYEQKFPNAAYQRASNTMFIATSTLELLNEREVRAVMGHEVGHRTQRNLLLAAAVAFTAVTVAATSYLTSKIKNPLGDYLHKKAPKIRNEFLKENTEKLGTAIQRAPWAVTMGFGVVAGAIGWLLDFPKAMLSRFFEMDADKKSAEKLGDPEALISALRKMEAYMKQIRREQIPPTDAASHGQRVPPPPPPEPPSAIQKAKSSHPDNPERITQLEEIAARQRLEKQRTEAGQRHEYGLNRV